MTQEELQRKYEHLIDRVARMRAVQDHYEKYRIGADRDRKRALEKQVDNLVAEEFKRKGTQQKEMF